MCFSDTHRFVRDRYHSQIKSVRIRVHLWGGQLEYHRCHDPFLHDLTVSLCNMSCIWFISAVVLLSLVPRLFYPELHTDSCVSIAQHHANTTALYSALSAELQQQVANAEETMSKFEELFETTKASRQRQEEVSNNIEKIRARLDLLNSKQEALLMRQSEIKITADEIFEYSVSQANKMEYQLQSALTKVTGERDIAQAKVIELKMTGSRLQNIRNMASTLLHFAANVKAKSEEQSQSLQIALAEVASRRDEVYSCPQPSPEKRSLDDESIVSLITERIIQNITSRTAEAKLHQLPPLRPPPPPRHPPDYALFAAGSKILRQQTSSTYFHPTLRVDQQIKEFLGTLGTPFNALGGTHYTHYTHHTHTHTHQTQTHHTHGSHDSHQTDLVPPISGRSFLDFFHLEAMMNLGTPEDAITTDMSIGACWPMEVSFVQCVGIVCILNSFYCTLHVPFYSACILISRDKQGSTGNLTVQLFTSITVGSVSIDHIKRYVLFDAYHESRPHSAHFFSFFPPLNT